MRFVSSQGDVETRQPAYKGYGIAILMFLTAVIQTMFLHQYFQLCFVTGMRVIILLGVLNLISSF
jgi:ATP-binding cassette, subfamily C (CFTR/MRP), member 1